MPSTSANAPAELGPTIDDARMLSRLFGWVGVLAGVFALGHASSALLLGSSSIAALSGLHLTLAIIAYAARAQVRGASPGRGIDVMVVGLLLLAVAWTAFMPTLQDVGALGPILAVAFAVPFRSGLAFARIVAGAIVSTVMVIFIGGMTLVPTPSAYIEALRAPSFFGGMFLIILTLWLFGRRLQGSIAQATHTVELLRTRERAIAATSSGVIIVDVSQPGWPIIFVNPAFERLTGYSAAEVIGTDGGMLVGPETDKAELARHRGMIEAGKDGSVTILNYRRDGTTFWNELTVSPIPDEAGQINQYVVIQTDVTATRELEVQLRQAQRMESVGQLAGGIAHDFNNLLTAIRGYAHVALDDVKDLTPAPAVTDVTESLDEIVRASDRAASLTRQLLAFGRRQVLQARVVPVESVVVDVLPMLRRLIGEQYRLETRLAAEVPPVVADPGQLEQVLVNLTLNARDASVGGGRIVIETTAVEVPEGAPDGTPVGRYARLIVSDEGTGMAQAVQDRIFEPFFTTKQRGHGTGLGLATVYGIVAQSGGRIRCRSKEGVGTSFEIDLPAEVGVEMAPGAAADMMDRVARPDGPPAGHELILVAEDEAAVRSLSATILGRAGYRVIQATGVDNALELAGRHGAEISLLLTDVVMPDLSGPELAERILDITPMPVLFMSGYPDDVLSRTTGSGLAILPKPFTADELLAAVRGALDARSGAPSGQGA